MLGSSVKQNTMSYFEPYQLSNPPLLGAINDIVNSGLNKLGPAKGANALDMQSSSAIEIPLQSRQEGDLARLEVFREAFQRFIDDFNIYKPFLEQVKYEYDNIVSQQTETVKVNTNIKLQLVATEESYKQKMREMEVNHELKLNEALRQKTKSDVKLAKKTEKLTKLELETNDLKKEKDKLRVEFSETQITCLTLTNALSRYEEDSKYKQASEKQRNQDIVTLKANYVKATEEITRLRDLLSEMQAIQAHMVTYDVVEQLRTRVKELEARYSSVDSAHKSLISRYSSIKAVIDDAFKSYIDENASPVSKIRKHENSSRESDDEIEKKLDVFVNKRTHPRILIEMLIDQIEDLKTVNRRLEVDSGVVMISAEGFGEGTARADVGSGHVLSKEEASELDPNTDTAAGATAASAPAATTLADRSPWAHFDGLGHGDSVPRHMRWLGSVQNLFFSRLDIQVFIIDIFSKKARFDAENSGAVDGSFNYYFDHYIDSLYPTNRARAVEFAYNFVHSLAKFPDDSDCKLVRCVLTSDLSADAWEGQHAFAQRVISAIQDDLSSRGQQRSAQAMISTETLIRLLKRHFTHFPDHTILKIVKAVHLEAKGSREINYVQLLSRGEYGFKNKLLDALCLEYIQGLLTFTEVVMDNLNRARSRPGESDVLVSRLRHALVNADPHRSRSEVNALLARGCGCDIEEALLREGGAEAAPLEDFKRRLKIGLLEKTQESD